MYITRRKVEEIKVNVIWLIRYLSAFRKKISQAEKRVGIKFCALSLLCDCIWQWKYQASGLLDASNQL